MGMPQHTQRQNTINNAGANRNRQQIGAHGEALAAQFLEQSGYRILDRNWRAGRLGELDLVATQCDVIVAVEVKTRTTFTHGSPLEAVTPQKVRRLRQLLMHWLREHNVQAKSLRVDAIAVTFDNRLNPIIDHIEAIQ